MTYDLVAEVRRYKRQRRYCRRRHPELCHCALRDAARRQMEGSWDLRFVNRLWNQFAEIIEI